jgi:hypothetical protein
METRPSRTQWAVALAALVGGVAGSFVAPSMDSLGVSTEGSLPVLAGGAAIYVASLLGALLGATAGASTAFAIGRRRHQAAAATLGSLAGIVVGMVVGYCSEGLAQAWINAFSGNPLEGALVGGAIGGGFAGVAAAAALRVFRSSGAPSSRERTFAALVGTIAGLLTGMGGASIGATLAESVLVCPNGYYTNPSTLPGCVVGILQGALLLGIWAGAVCGAIAALATAFVLSRLGTVTTATNPAAQD